MLIHHFFFTEDTNRHKKIIYYHHNIFKICLEKCILIFLLQESHALDRIIRFLTGGGNLMSNPPDSRLKIDHFIHILFQFHFFNVWKTLNYFTLGQTSCPTIYYHFTFAYEKNYSIKKPFFKILMTFYEKKCWNKNVSTLQYKCICIIVS